MTTKTDIKVEVKVEVEVGRFLDLKSRRQFKTLIAMSKNISDDEYLKILEEAFEEAWEIANSKNEGR